MIKYDETDPRVAAARRLGVSLIQCPTCDKHFDADRIPRFWINVMVDGELSDAMSWPTASVDVSELCCSMACAEQYVESLRNAEPEDSNVGYAVWEEADRPMSVKW